MPAPVIPKSNKKPAVFKNFEIHTPIPCTAECMLSNITVAKNIYIVSGYTDMRKSIDGLAAIVQQQFY